MSRDISVRKDQKVEKMVLGAVLTALVIVLQLLATFTTFFGPFATAVALIPIGIGAILCGPVVAAWLGLVFGIVVLASGGANFFFVFDIPGAVITTLAKGLLCGLVAGLTYRLLERFNRLVASIAAAIVCPVVNTGVFLLGCAVFFLDDVVDIAAALGSAEVGMAVFVSLALANFLCELAASTVLSPLLVRLLEMRKKA